MKTRKNINKFRVLSVLALAVLSLSSCLKDPRYVNFAGSPPLVEFPLAAVNANKTTVLKISTSANPTYTLQFAIDIASPAANGAVTPTIAVDNTGLIAPAPAAVTTGGYFPLPPADYTISTLTPTIPAGHGTDAIVNVVINTALIGTVNKNYELRIIITNGGGQQISSYNALVWNVQVTP